MRRSVLILGLALILCMTAVTAYIPYSKLEVYNDTATNNVDNVVLSQDPDPAEPGKYVEIRLKVQNTGSDFAEGVKFQLIPEYPFSLRPGDNGILELGTVYSRAMGKDGAILYYKVKVDEDAVEGKNQLRLKYYEDGIGWTEMKPFDVRVQTHDAILSIDSVTTEPEVIEPGKQATIKIALDNQADSVIKNIKVMWTPITITSTASATAPVLEELPFTPIGSTNEKILYQLKAKEQEMVEFNILASPDAESKDYKVQLQISYEDELGTDYTIDNVMGLIVGNSPDISVTLEESDITKAGSKGTASIRFVNKDVMDIKFVTVELDEGDCFSIFSPEEVYLGNIDSDDYETADFEMFVKDKEGCEIMPVEITYKDANNNEYMKKVDISLKLYTEKESQEMGLVEKSNTVGVVIVIIIVVGGLLTWRYLKKKKGKKRQG